MLYNTIAYHSVVSENIDLKYNNDTRLLTINVRRQAEIKKPASFLIYLKRMPVFVVVIYYVVLF
jgi:hypothetical protein